MVLLSEINKGVLAVMYYKKNLSWMFYRVLKMPMKSITNVLIRKKVEE